ncbi:hypothetical protein C8Q74DRAFT_1320211 [Fomes fomentarius]|nr:hypothetical protein C8Q74DRAFT_1320211 [Fomes fomentarius]
MEAEQEAAEDARDEAEGFQRDEEFWFDDGTIILAARKVAFEVYKRPLSEHSPVFKDMLSLPQPEESGSGPCPLIHLEDDAPEDLRHVFRVLMPGKTLRLFGTQTITYHKISALIRIGHKYQMDHLVQQSLDYLRTIVCSKGPPVWRLRQYSIGVVNLTRLTGAHHLLPCALMQCCSLGSSVVDGFAREDGTREYLSPQDLGLCFNAKDKLIEARV